MIRNDEYVMSCWCLAKGARAIRGGKRGWPHVSPSANSIAMVRFARQNVKTSCSQQHPRGVLLTAALVSLLELFVKTTLMNSKYNCAERFREAPKGGKGKASTTSLISKYYYWLMLLSWTAEKRGERCPRTARTCKPVAHNVATHSGIFFVLFLRHSLIRSPAVSLCEKNNENHGPRVH